MAMGDTKIRYLPRQLVTDFIPLVCLPFFSNCNSAWQSSDIQSRLLNDAQHSPPIAVASWLNLNWDKRTPREDKIYFDVRSIIGLKNLKRERILGRPFFYQEPCFILV